MTALATATLVLALAQTGAAVPAPASATVPTPGYCGASGCGSERPLAPVVLGWMGKVQVLLGLSCPARYVVHDIYLIGNNGRTSGRLVADTCRGREVFDVEFFPRGFFPDRASEFDARPVAVSPMRRPRDPDAVREAWLAGLEARHAPCVVTLEDEPRRTWRNDGLRTALWHVRACDGRVSYELKYWPREAFPERADEYEFIRLQPEAAAAPTPAEH